MDTKVTVDTEAQAEFADNLHRAARNLGTTLHQIEKDAARSQQNLDSGMMPHGIGHQALNEVVKYQAEFEVLASMAISQGLTAEQVHTLVTSQHVWVTVDNFETRNGYPDPKA